MRHYSASRLKVLRECLRKHYYQYRLGIRMPATFAMAFGTIGHSALEAYFLAWRDGRDRLADAFAVIGDSSLSRFDQAKLRALVLAYDERWGDEPWDILGVEIEFRYKLGDFTIAGKIDALIRDQRDGRIYVLEHKTTALDASLGSAYWEKLSIDTQVSIYVDGATMLGYEIAGCVYDVIKRPQHEQKLATPIESRKYTAGKGCKLCGGNLQGKQGSGKSTATTSGDCAICKGTGWRLDADGNAEAPRLHANQRATDETLDELELRVKDAVADAPDSFLIRGVVVRLDDELPQMRQDLIDSIKVERAADLFGLYPRNPDACSRYGQLCSFFDACANRASIDDPHRFPRDRTAHVEPSAAAA